MARKLSNIPLDNQLNGLMLLEKHLNLKKAHLLDAALQSDNPVVLMKANEILQNIQTREESERKSYLFDPHQFNMMAGYKEKPISLSYDILRRISYVVPVIRAIINTRIDQICSFCEPQKNKYSTGFIIRKKQGYFFQEENKPTRSEQRRINAIAEIVMNCGVNRSYANDDFDQFTRKVMNDSLTFDAMTFEPVTNKRGEFFEAVAIDAATIRLADSYDDETYQKERKAGNWFVPQRAERKKVKGYFPSYCQILDGSVYQDFYPWELCFGVRNPTTNIYANGYGVSEIEMLLNTVTSLLWSDEYNRKFFSQGSSPKGLLKVKNTAGPGGALIGNNNNTKISEFRQKWQAMMSGVNNAWKIPILEADVDWIDLQKTNQEMEFQEYVNFLICVCCGVWRIDPEEINFKSGGMGSQPSLFEGNNEARLKHSKDKGLKPLLKFYERKLNKYIISAIDPAYELVFVGLDEEDAVTELDSQVKQVQNFQTIDEIRALRGLKPLGKENGGNLVLNGVWFQWYNQQQQMQQQEQMYGNQGEYDSSLGGPFDGDGPEQSNAEYQNQLDEENGEDKNQQQDKQQQQDNPFEKAFSDYFQKLIRA